MDDVFYILIRSDNWVDLIEEIDLDVRRMSSRNLGRDDRWGCFYMPNLTITSFFCIL